MADYVFLHGGKQGSWIWTETIDALKAQDLGAVDHIVTLDVPGCGAKRDRAVATLSFEDIACELAQDIAASGVSDAILIGHSQAGTVIPRLLEALPEAFRRVVYVTCSAPEPGRTVRQTMGWSIRGTHADEIGWPADPALGFAHLLPLMFCNDMDAGEIAAFTARLGQDEWPPCYHDMTDWRYDAARGTPSTYVLCLDDRAVPLAWQEKFAGRFGVDRRVAIQAGHQVMNTRPQTLAEVLRFEARV